MMIILLIWLVIALLVAIGFFVGTRDNREERQMWKDFEEEVLSKRNERDLS